MRITLWTLAIGVLLAACARSISAPDLSTAMAGDTFTRQGDYIISAGDQVVVKVYGQEALSDAYTVAASGTITLPLVGFVRAAGLTTPQLIDRLTKVLSSYIKKPFVTVAVANRDSYQVYLSGHVGRPGAVTLQNRLTLLQGLALGGGLTADASGRILLLRHAADGSVKRYATTYLALLAGQRGLDRILLERGDVIHAE